MNFIKYQHIERFGTTEVEGIELGECYIFPKIDGTNGSVWLDEAKIPRAGSRRRQLYLGKEDNAGFCQWMCGQENIIEFLKDNPHLRLFGEWLVPHSLKTYRDTAWQRFYVFDVAVDKPESEILHEGNHPLKYLHYEVYKPILEAYEIDYIPPIAIIKNGSYEQFVNQLEKNIFLIQDGKGTGEGVVIKNYGFKNKYGRQPWAKIITSEFKEKHAKEMGAPVMNGKEMVEKQIAGQYVTTALCNKVKAKIENENNGFRSSDIFRLLNTVFHDVVAEESWEYVKKYNNPTINYKTLQHFVFREVKECLPELF